MNEQMSRRFRMLIGGILGILVLFPFCGLLNHFLWPGDGSSGIRIALVNPALTALTGARWSAVLIQAALYFLMGALVGLATAPFNDDTRKLFLQSLLHFLVTAAVYGLMFRLFGWTRGETAVFLVEMGCLVVIYLTVWLVRWLFWYFEVREIAEKLGIPESRGQGIRWVLWGIAAAVTVVMLLLIIGFVRGRLLPG